MNLFNNSPKIIFFKIQCVATLLPDAQIAKAAHADAVVVCSVRTGTDNKLGIP